jgi:hypothetical protein
MVHHIIHLVLSLVILLQAADLSPEKVTFALFNFDALSKGVQFQNELFVLFHLSLGKHLLLLQISAHTADLTVPEVDLVTLDTFTFFI